MAIHVARGLPKALAGKVADALSDRDELESHARDGLGIIEPAAAKPAQAALASAASFVSGGLAPLLRVLLAPPATMFVALLVVTIVTLAVLGAAGARAGGAPIGPGGSCRRMGKPRYGHSCRGRPPVRSERLGPRPT